MPADPTRSGTTPEGIWSDIAVVIAGKDFLLNGTPMPGLPLMVSEQGVVEPVARYVAERYVRRRGSIGSAVDEIYVLRDWLRWLAGAGREWHRPDDDLIAAWLRESQVRGVAGNRLRRRHLVVFNFYRVSQEVLGIIEGVVERPGQGPSGRLCPIRTQVVDTRGPRSRSQALILPLLDVRTAARRTGRRPTPTVEDAEKVCDALLAKEDSLSSARGWSCAKCMLLLGLRRAGVAEMRLEHLADALAAAGLLAWGGIAGASVIMAMGRDPAAQQRMCASLGKARGVAKAALQLEVVEKGGKARLVPVPLTLMRVLLEYVWGPYRAAIPTLPGKGRFLGGGLWPSRKTGRPLTAKAIADDIKGAFRAAGVKGSGHRLRATFCTELVRELYWRAKAAHGQAWDHEAVLLQAAELMGHRSTSTLRHYLDLVVVEENLLQGEVVMVRSEEGAKLLRAIAVLLDSEDPASVAKASAIADGLGLP